MAEISCPSCQAKYNVPDAALGTDGRLVSCANCGNDWHAMPPAVEEPLVLSDRVFEDPPAPEPEPEPAVAAERIREDRAKQLAEIRQIVDEVQNAPEPAQNFTPEPDPVATPEPAAAAPAPVVPIAPVAEQERMSGDPLREKIDGRPKTTPPDTEKSRKTLMRKHSKRARKRLQSDKRGNGLFMTGFLLIVIVVAVMVALYLLAPQIIAQSPGMEAPLTEYVARIDELRGSASAIFGNVRDTVVALMGLNEEG